MAHGPRSFNEARGSSGAALQQILSREDRNIVGGGFGRRTTAGVRLSTPACVVYVVRKLPADALPRERLLPRTMEINGVTVEVDVEETGPFRALEYTDWVKRPVPSGVSIGNVGLPIYGTFGCLVRDLSNGGRLSILSNWHVLARRNNARPGERITQPGSSTAEDHTIGTLARWVNINFNGDNYVDCAIAHVSGSNVVANKTMGDQAVIKVPSMSQPAVGLLFAGSGTRTIMNPMSAVLRRLNVELLDRAAYEDYGDDDEAFRISVAKSGARTEVTRNNLQEIDVSAKIDYDNIGEVKFVHQITANVMSCGGDSGSVICRVPPAPEYGHVPCAEPSSCAFLGTAERMTGIPFSQEGDLVRTARDKYLAQTKVGRWLIDMVYVNQRALFERGESTQVQPGDRALAQALYTRYLGEVKLAIADPARDDLRLTTAHLADVQLALTSLKKYLTEQEAGAADVLYNMLQGQVGKKPSELIAMLDDPGVHQTVITLFGEAPFLADPYTG
ncbi:hypothetical protein FH608_018230 [Nonomuraea phyllanthi]|uniref:Uncharacterized protein n=1 Tax=Nonomuraea phyllanthi TaxID=2219224 RepID=A0A5C4WKJ4_9ACTN|nr:hypothetical protein [Nonomuraea phyllanthi]KAB8194116.1 hypothetical protein FH608_018230 [Nonomuraea phyllanthi]QFY07718.1 hypothetical protein GBF35_14395 [Nonomuraea phyllanthi]